MSLYTPADFANAERAAAAAWMRAWVDLTPERCKTPR
jgi:hypothetical protein